MNMIISFRPFRTIIRLLVVKAKCQCRLHAAKQAVSYEIYILLLYICVYEQLFRWKSEIVDYYRHPYIIIQHNWSHNLFFLALYFFPIPFAAHYYYYYYCCAILHFASQQEPYSILWLLAICCYCIITQYFDVRENIHWKISRSVCVYMCLCLWLLDICVVNLPFCRFHWKTSKTK